MRAPKALIDARIRAYDVLLVATDKVIAAAERAQRVLSWRRKVHVLNAHKETA